MQFRAATAADLAAISALQVASWRRAYRGLLPEAFLAGEVAAVLGRRWAVLPGADWIVDTAWEGGRLAGFISVDRARAGGAYVDNLHVAASAEGRGVGRALMVRAAARLAEEGARALWLTVIRDNARARGFYRGLGGVEAPEQVEMLYGHPVTTHRVDWYDLAALARLGGPVAALQISVKNPADPA